MLLTAAAGERWHDLVRYSLGQGLGGLENLALIPGSAGASESGFVQLFRVLFHSAIIVPAMLLSRVASFYFILILSGLVSLAMHLVHSYRQKHLPKPVEPEPEIQE